MLWVLKRTITMRWFFWAHKTYDMKIFTILHSDLCFVFYVSAKTRFAFQKISPWNRSVAYPYILINLQGRIAQLVMYLTADSGVASSIPAPSHTLVEIDREIISMAILLPSADSRRVCVSYKRKYVHEVLVNRLVKLAQEKSVVMTTWP